MKALHKIKEPLTDLNNMVGMKSLKENIVDQILYYIQDINKSGDFMHTVIYGPPGTGKTEIAKIIGAIFSKLGILKKGNFKKVTRSDLVAGYLGQTAMKTRDVINECLGGVLFIDEAYALGNNDKKDSFSKECIDTLCEALSDHKDNLMVIVAGYEKELNETFFKVNSGMNSRFIWKFTVDSYSPRELMLIFEKHVKDCDWSFADDYLELHDSTAKNIMTNTQWFIKHKDHFKHFGRDMELLFSYVKIAHAKRIYGKNTNLRKKISKLDLEKGYETFLENKKQSNSDISRILNSGMYV
jgi:SpoVK/Ycf46/Vps4 family AAA+-type ATPase